MLLSRFCFSKTMGTFGILNVHGESFYTLEPQNNNNMPFNSCIPEGVYNLYPIKSEKHGFTFQLENPHLNVHTDKQNEYSRYGIIIHIGNTLADTEGCILIGDSLGSIGGKWAVTNSTKAMQRMLELCRGFKPITITVKNR